MPYFFENPCSICCNVLSKTHKIYPIALPNVLLVYCKRRLYNTHVPKSASREHKWADRNTLCGGLLSRSVGDRFGMALGSFWDSSGIIIILSAKNTRASNNKPKQYDKQAHIPPAKTNDTRTQSRASQTYQTTNQSTTQPDNHITYKPKNLKNSSKSLQGVVLLRTGITSWHH